MLACQLNACSDFKVCQNDHVSAKRVLPHYVDVDYINSFTVTQHQHFFVSAAVSQELRRSQCFFFCFVFFLFSPELQ